MFCSIRLSFVAPGVEYSRALAQAMLGQRTSK